MEHYRKHRSQDAAADCAGDAFETAAQGPEDVRLQHDERCEEQPVAVVNVQQKNQRDINAADKCYTNGVAQRERFAGKVCDKQLEVRSLTKLPEALMHIAGMPG